MTEPTSSVVRGHPAAVSTGDAAARGADGSTAPAAGPRVVDSAAVTPVVFIAGCGRSGTSYLRTLVDAHPDVFIPSESLFLTDYLKYGAALPSRLLHWLFWREPQLLCWYDAPPVELATAAELFAYASMTMARRAGARLWGQKTPRFVRDIALFDATWPGLRWILIYRDPRAVAASMLASAQHTYSLRAACDRWLRDNAPVLAQLQHPAANVLVVKYETLIGELQQTMDRVFAHIGVAPAPVAELLANARPVFFSRSRFANNTIRAGIEPTRAANEAWRRQLSPGAVRYVERRCGEAMRVLGYEIEAPPGAGSAAPASVLKDALILTEYLFKWPEYLFHTLLRKALMHGFDTARRCASLLRS